MNFKISSTLKTSRETRDRSNRLHATTIDLIHGFGQLDLAPETEKDCRAAIAGERTTGHYRFKEGFYYLADMLVVFYSKTKKCLKK